MKEVNKALKYAYQNDALFHSLIDLKAVGLVNAEAILDNLNPIIANKILELLDNKENIEVDLTRNLSTLPPGAPFRIESNELTRITKELCILLGSPYGVRGID